MLAPRLLLRLLACAPAPDAPAPDPPAPAASAPADAPDLVLVIAPGLRADPPGVEGPEAALIAGLGRAPDWRFRAAYAQSTAASISAGSLLTGLYPSAIPLCAVPGRRPGGAQVAPLCSAIPASTPMLPEILSLYGYRAGLVATPHTDALFGEGRGFEAREVIQSKETRDRASWDDLAAAAAAWWAADASRPRLLVLGLPDFGAPGQLAHEYWNAHYQGRERAPKTPQEALDPDALAALYQATAVRLGERLGALREALGPAWWVVTSTNGLSLGETTAPGPPPRREHLKVIAFELVLDRTARVPLWVYAPTPRPAPVDERAPVELVDVAPTLARRAQATPPAGPGGDLLRPGDGPARAYTEFGDMLVLRDAERTLTFRCYRAGSSSLDPALTECLERTLGGERGQQDGMSGRGNLYLHDVREDYLQGNDRARAERARMQSMGAALLELRRGAGAPPGGALSPALMEELAQERRGYW